jgi:hypothetical protein
MATANGRPRREAIARQHAEALFPQDTVDIPVMEKQHGLSRPAAGVDR